MNDNPHRTAEESRTARRVRVVHPRTAAVRRVPSRGVLHEMGDETVLGEIYLRSLVRSQMRLGLLVCACAALTLGGTALWMALDPGLDHRHWLGMPAGWLILGIAVYPVLIGMGAYFVRHAEHNERDFAVLVRDR
ncbi:MAG TPA: hypothetical protein VGH11_18925 [Jatrophihabitans sp.]|jgi:hypothetical protein